jgi:glycosyltransferase involved in cell wall biosynthesis
MWLGARLSGRAAFIINNSRNSALAHERELGYCAGKQRVVPNGFDTDEFVASQSARDEVRAELGLPPDALLISLVGRYHPVKDHPSFLKAASILLAQYPSAHFMLVGEGVDAGNAELSAQLRDPRLRAAVHLMGLRDDVQRLTAGADVATSSSLSEGFPNTIGEAMACAVPCVATDVGDSAWLVGSTGRIVPPGRPDALARAWAELIALGAEGRQRLGALARQRVVDHFSIESVVRQYEALYDEALGAGGRP